MLVALGLPLGFVATAPSGSSSACARYRSVLDVVVHMNMEATRDGEPTMSASRLTGGTSKFAAQHTNTVLDMGLMVDPIARNCLDRNAKIVSTLGPASFSQEMIEKLVAAGVDIFRLNSSHRRPGQFEELIPWIREAGRKAGRKVEILGDIQGPKFRCSMTEGDQPVPLEGGSTVQLGLCVDDNDLTRPGRVALTPTIEQTALVKGVQPGMTLLFDDGLMEVKMLSRISETEVTCAVIEGGTLKSRKGINVPELQIDLPPPPATSHHLAPSPIISHHLPGARAADRLLRPHHQGPRGRGVSARRQRDLSPNPNPAPNPHPNPS